MTDFPNPFERETVPGHEFEVPAPIDIASHTTIDRFMNRSGQSFAVLLFEEGGEVPQDIAFWLRHRSHTDVRITTQTSEDRYRFDKVTDIQERFLRDQNGRRLYAAIDEQTGELSGAIWLHALEGGETGASIVYACDAYNEKQDNVDNQLDTTKLATLASRVYTGARHSGVHTPFLLSALEDYYTQWPECEGVVIRMSGNDANAVGAFSVSESLKARAEFAPICKEDGVIFMLNRGLKSLDDIHSYAPRPFNEF